MSEYGSELSLGSGFGAPLDDAIAGGIAVVGFDEDFYDNDALLVGFDEPAPAPAARGPEKARRIAAALHRLGTRCGSLALSVASQLRYWLIGTQLRARRMRTALIMLGAVGLSVGCGLVLRNWLPAKAPVKAVLEAASLSLPRSSPSVLVARRAIPRGHIMQPGDLTWQPWPADQLRDRFIRIGAGTPEETRGKVAVEPLAEGEPVSRDKLVAPGDRGFMSAVLRPGMRAVSLAINPDTAPAGLIMPGDRIDIVLTMPIPVADRRDPNDTSDNRYGTETVLNDVRVLAIDQQLDAPEHPLLGSTATVEATPKQAEILALSQYLAEFYASKVSLTVNSLAENESPDRAGAMVDADISKYLPRRETAASRRRAKLTIVRRGVAGDAGGS